MGVYRQSSRNLLRSRIIAGMEIRTSRLVLRSLERADLDQMLPLITREVAATTLRITHPYTRKDAEEYFDGMQSEIAKDKMLQMSIFVASSDEYCGSVGLRIEREHGRAELGYWLGVPYWGQGYASEATQAVVAYGFGELGLNRIYATVFAGNTASCRVVGKAGLKYEGCMCQHVNKWGRFLDVEVYGLLVADWRNTVQ